MRKTKINGVEIVTDTSIGKFLLVLKYPSKLLNPHFEKKHIPKLIKTLESFLDEKPTKKYDKANYLKARVRE